MKISLNWLQDFIELNPKISVEQIAWKLTEATAEVERIKKIGHDLNEVVVGEIMEFRKHHNADKLSVAQVKIGPKKTIQVIFGQKAPIKVGDKVPVAVAPTKLHAGEIKITDLRGEKSEGMLCLDSELFEGGREILFYCDPSAKVGSKITDVLPIKDVVFEIDNHSITHRADLFSQYGFCREFVALGLAKWKKQYAQYKPKKMSGKKKLPFTVKFNQKEIASNYHGTIVENLDSRQSPPYIHYRLQACGIRSINAIVDITNYVMLETGAPMHGFDSELLKGKEFLFRLSHEGETMRTLDGKEHALFKNIMLVENDGKIIDLLGIMGGENSSIRPTTHSVYFHQGIYHPVMIRKAMIGLGHRTDAGTIFEKGVHDELSEIGICRTIELVKQIFPEAKLSYEMVHFRHRKIQNKKVRLNTEKIATHLGVEIELKEARKILEFLGCKVTGKGTAWVVEVPNWRANSLNQDVDLVEDIARIYGYSKIPAELPMMKMKQPVRKSRIRTRRLIRQSLMSQGLLEELNWTFVEKKMAASLPGQSTDDAISIRNPVSEDFQYLRSSQLPIMLRNLSRNLKIEQKEYQSFEMGKVFRKKNSEVIESDRITIVMSGIDSFRRMKGTLEILLSDLQLFPDWRNESSENASPGHVLEVSYNSERIGLLYEVHPKILDAFDIRQSVAVGEIDLEKLFTLDEQKKQYRPVNRFPEVSLDLSIVVPEDCEFKKLQTEIKKVQPNLFKSLHLKDIYRSHEIGKSKKSITVGLRYQAPDRTIESVEVDSILNELIKKMEKIGGTVRV